MVYGDGRVDHKRALAALDRVGLAARANHYATELSGGEQQLRGDCPRSDQPSRSDPGRRAHG